MKRRANNPGKTDDDRWTDIINTNKTNNQESVEEKEENEQRKLKKAISQE